jgi:predicted RNase H-like HicB family nuclease
MVKEPTYMTEWSEEDHVFVARVLGWPFLAAHGDTEEEALHEIRVVVAAVIEDLNKEHQ